MQASPVGRTGYELREGSAMIAERIPREERRRGEYAVRYRGQGHGWWVVQWDVPRSDPAGPCEWLTVAGPFTTREAAIENAQGRRQAEAAGIGGPGWSVKA